MFERGSNPSLRRANRAAKQQGNQRASQPTNPLFNVATIINHLGYLYFCISLWDSRHIQAIGAKFSSLSIYIYIYTRDDGSITRLARLVFILYPGCHPARHLPLLPFPLAGRVHLDFHEFRSRKHGGRQHHRRRHPSRAMSRASQPSFSRPFSTPSTPSIRSFSRNCSSYANVVLAQQDSSSSESESRWNVVLNFCRFNFFSPFFFFLRRDFNFGIRFERVSNESVISEILLICFVFWFVKR